MNIPETQYVRIGDYNIAYQVFGAGPPDVLFVRGNWNHLELQWEEPHLAAFLRGLGEFARVIVYDDRGSGMSDPTPGGGLAPHESRAEDALAVLDAVGADEVVAVGTGGGSMRAMMLAASHPERVMALAIVAGRASNQRHEDYPWGLTESEHQRGRDAKFLTKAGGIPDEHAAWFERYRRLSASRGLRSAMFRGGMQIDVRNILPSIHASTLVVEHKAWVQAGPGKYIADRIPNSRFVELPDGMFGEWRFDDPGRVVEVLREFITGEKAPPPINRVLATILFTDVVGSTSANAQRGDRRWTQTLDSFDEFAKRQVDRFGGRFVKSTGDGHLATFDSPGRAILCATAMRDGVGRFELEIRAGLHTGEIELRADDIGGMAVNIGRRICDVAGPDEVIVSGTVPPLVAGSGIEFDTRGEQELKGVPGRWQLFAVKS